MSPEEIKNRLRQQHIWIRENYYYGEPADFSNCNLRGANFSGRNLRSVNFRGADLEGASFRNSLLYNVDFRLANLKNADFTNTRGFDNILCLGANFEGALVPYIPA